MVGHRGSWGAEIDPRRNSATNIQDHNEGVRLLTGDISAAGSYIGRGMSTPRQSISRREAAYMQKPLNEIMETLGTLVQAAEAVENRFNSIDQRLERSEQVFDRIEQRFDKVEGDIGSLQSNVLDAGMKLANIEAAMSHLPTKDWTFRWIATLAAGGVGLAVACATIVATIVG